MLKTADKEEIKRKLHSLDSSIIRNLQRISFPFLRISLGIVFLWFGALKVFGVSPAMDLIKNTFSFFPAGNFILILGFWEMAIGLGLIFKIALRFTLFLLWLQMLGTFFAPVLKPEIFFNYGNIFLLTMEGEFVVKNLVLVAGSLVVGFYELSSKILDANKRT